MLPTQFRPHHQPSRKSAPTSSPALKGYLTPVNLSDYLDPGDIHFDLRAEDKSAVLRELVSYLHLDPESEAAVLRILNRREEMGSTGIGRGIAVPHCRTPIVRRLRVLYGGRPGGIGYDAVDGHRVEHFFLLIAPPVEASNEYLPVLGRIAQLAKDQDVPARLASVETPDAFHRLLAEKGV